MTTSEAHPHRPATRRTPLAARGEPMVWLTGACLAVGLLMIAALLAAVITQGSRTFWQAPIERIVLRNGDVFLGMPVRDEVYEALGDERAALDALAANPTPGLPPDAIDDEGRPRRRLYRVGNREVYGEPFRWAPLYTIAESGRPEHALLLERREWGVWIGMPEAILRVDLLPAPAEGGFEPEGVVETPLGPRPVRRSIIAAPGGEPRLREEVRLTDGPEEALAAWGRLHAEAIDRWDQMRALNEGAVGDINHRMERERLELREVELKVAEGRATEAELAAATAAFEETRIALDAEYAEVRARVAEIDREDARWRILVTEPLRGRFAPIRQTEPDEALRVSQVVRAVPANDLDFAGRLAVYLDRWREFVFDEPRDANTAGGVFPVIFCTVLLTVLLSLFVAPLGVIAALYLREYAKQGVIVSAVRIAVNNLAGVPSIVYGVFGLGFFCYTIGRYIDAGPTETWPRSTWLIGLAGLVGIVAIASTAAIFGRPIPGKQPSVRHRALGWIAGVMWVGGAALVVLLLARTPFFHGFHRASLPNPTFGTKGLLWSSLTLALLTLPVVIVATEEAISAVPRSLREGSYGCGASKWQTIRRIVLPRAAPGIMTGMILAMARGAGEVAPLMLVGAVKLAPELPFSSHFPFIHLERSFMHLGFHIYDVGFQSPDSEASRPIAWTTTLLLIVIIFVLNLTAISIRARLRRRFVTGAF